MSPSFRVIFSLRIAYVVTIGLLISVQAYSQIASKPETNWIELFNGNDLTGWRQRNGTASYRVEESTIVGRTSEGSPNSFLCTDREFDNFELTFEVMVDRKLNSGVQIRSHSTPDYKAGRVHGPQVEIEAGPGEAGYIYSEGTENGWISQDLSAQIELSTEKWNQYRVVAEGHRVRTWVNGVQVEDLIDKENIPESGFLALQVHRIPNGSGPFEVRWRKIRIRERP